MRYIISIFIFVLVQGSVFLQDFGQDWYTQSSQQQQLVFEVTTSEERLDIGASNIVSTMDDFAVQNPVLSDADLQIPYHYTIPKGDFLAQVKVSLHHEILGLIASTEIILDESKSGIITLEDMTENGLYLNQSYTLTIDYALLGRVDCTAEAPVFQNNKKVIPAGTTIAGLISLGIGELILRPRQKRAYEEYQDLWRKERPESEATSWYNEAEQIKQQREKLTYGGALVALGGAIWYGINYSAYRRNKRQYDRYCLPQKKFNIQPEINGSAALYTPGIKMSFQF